MFTLLGLSFGQDDYAAEQRNVQANPLMASPEMVVLGRRDHHRTMRGRQVNVGAVLFALVVAVAPTVAQTVTDGDTIKLDGTTYRLWGIDAPETKQWGLSAAHCDGHA